MRDKAHSYIRKEMKLVKSKWDAARERMQCAATAVVVALRSIGEDYVTCLGSSSLEVSEA